MFVVKHRLQFIILCVNNLQNSRIPYIDKQMPVGTSTKTQKILRLVALLIIGIGISIRLYVYLQNRNLIIDEANIARNIYERGFLALVQPLNYEQYAPPIFLWITKIFSLLFGMSEYALKLYPFLCGIAAYYVLYRILKHLVTIESFWYPLILFSFPLLIIRYTTELKQYMSDVLIALLLILFALSIDIFKRSTKQFATFWIVTGSLVIWASMPSVFLLAGIGCYYAWQGLATKQYNKILNIGIISLIWVAQFALYYIIILAPQANSDYLQNFHQQYFLYATPFTHDEWFHNKATFNALIYQVVGLYPYAYSIFFAFFISGMAVLARKATHKFLLLVVPILALLVAAALNQFSLLPRVSLFIIPILILISSYGFGQFVYLRSNILKGILIIAGIYAAGCSIMNYYEGRRPLLFEEMTTGLQFLMDNNVNGEDIFLYNSSVPAFIYYTEIHPNKEHWQNVKNAERTHWHTHYDSLGWQMKHVWKRKPVGFIYTNANDEQFGERDIAIRKHLQVVDSLVNPYVRTYIFTK